MTMSTQTPVAQSSDLWVGHVCNPTFAPVRLSSLAGVPTPFAIVVRAASPADAAAKLLRWHQIGDELHPLEVASGHTHCNDHCTCSSEVREAKLTLRRERLAISPND